MVEKIADLVREKRIEGISDLRDESSREGVRVVIEVKRDAVADVVLNQLYRFTPLQTSFGANMVALNGGRPEVLNLKDFISAFVEFREEVVSRRTRYLLNKDRMTDESKDPVARDYRDALKLLGLLAAGKFSLGADDPAAPAATGSTDVRFDSAPTVFNRKQLHAFR